MLINQLNFYNEKGVLFDSVMLDKKTALALDHMAHETDRDLEELVLAMLEDAIKKNAAEIIFAPPQVAEE